MLSHIAKTTPPALAAKELALFDNNVRQSFTECLALDPFDANWDQAKLSLADGGLGLRSLALHSSIYSFYYCFRHCIHS